MTQENRSGGSSNNPEVGHTRPRREKFSINDVSKLKPSSSATQPAQQTGGSPSPSSSSNSDKK